MKNVVNQAPFVQYPRVIKMLSAVEELFKNIESLPSASAEVGTRVPVRAVYRPFHRLFPPSRIRADCRRLHSKPLTLT